MLGDIHNFGLVVYRKDDIVVKPRSCLWEQEFFGWKAGFYNLMSDLSVLPNDTASKVSKLCGLEVLFVSRNQSQVTFYSEAISSIEYRESHVFAISSLLLFSFLFGMQDLHSDNIIVNNNGNIQVVDLECLFTNLSLPAQTLLFRFKSISEEHCGLNRILPTLRLYAANNTDDFCLLLYSIFCELFDFLFDNLKTIEHWLSTLQTRNMNVPIRIIPKRTSEYSKMIKNKNFAGCQPEELCQLERNEIPYFFTTLSDRQKLFYYENRSLMAKEVNNSNDFGYKNDSFPISANELLGNKENIYRKFHLCAATLMRELLPAKPSHAGSQNFDKLHIVGEYAIWRFKGVVVKTKLRV
jgi:hypothetical protein